MTPLTTREELLAALPGDWLLRQLANRWAAAEPAYALDGAVLMHHLWGHEPEPVVVGEPAGAATLTRAYWRAHGERPVSLPRAAGERLVAEDRVPEHEGWAFRWTTTAPETGEGAGWLDADDEVAEVLAKGFPDASMPAGHPDVRRWAGLRRDGRLVAVAADATQTAGLGFVASIATHPDARGTGAGLAVTAWITAALVAEHGRCGLWHMAHNTVAAAIYTRLGYRDDHPMAVVGQDPAPGR
jgi:GNAT superfamily N-acetyltransferase